MDLTTELAIGHKLRKIREIKGFSQEYVAGKLEVSQNTYSKIERGETGLSVAKLDLICRALDIDLNTLMNFDSEQVFNQCHTGTFGNNNTLYLNPVDEVKSLYEKLLQSKEEEIASLKREVELLRGKKK